jgi:hypothetical protein
MYDLDLIGMNRLLSRQPTSIKESGLAKVHIPCYQSLVSFPPHFPRVMQLHPYNSRRPGYQPTSNSSPPSAEMV